MKKIPNVRIRGLWDLTIDNAVFYPIKRHNQFKFVKKLKLIIAAVVAVLLLVLLLVILSEFGAFSGSDTRTVIVEKTIIQYVTDNKTVTSSTAPVNPPSSPLPSTSQPPPPAEVETTTELVELKP